MLILNRSNTDGIGASLFILILFMFGIIWLLSECGWVSEDLENKEPKYEMIKSNQRIEPKIEIVERLDSCGNYHNDTTYIYELGVKK